jgi:L-rhamnonate dehydratase
VLRWRIAVLVSAAIAISYLDRQTLPVAIHAIQKDIPLSNQQFSYLQSSFLVAYAFMYAAGGKLIDALGSRRGFTLIMVAWSLACLSHGIATSFAMLAVSRFLLGAGEGGGFPAATRVVAEWFSVEERSTAMGIINGGSAVGAVIMKIKEIRTRVVQWKGKTVPLPPHFCTNPMDAVSPMLTRRRRWARSRFTAGSSAKFSPTTASSASATPRSSPLVTKQVIDLYLKPLLIGADPWDTEFLWQHMYRKTMAFGRKGIAMVAISAVDIALWDIARQVREAAGLSPARRAHEAAHSRFTPAGFTARRWKNSRANRKIQGRRLQGDEAALRLGAVDGAEGMQKNVALVRTVRETVGDGIDIMADAYMGWNLDYAKRMMPLLEPFNLRWLEEPVIPDDIHGYAELKRFGRIPIAGGEHEFTLYGFRELIEARAVDYIQFDTNRVGGITQARKIAALAEAHQIPVIPHAGQMHNYHVVMASLNSPMAEFFPPVDVEVGNELFWYIFNGEPKDGFIELDENLPGLGLTVNEKALEKFEVLE